MPSIRSRIESTRRTFSCLLCSKADTGPMVQCDECDGWFHFECAGVTNAIKDQPWSCSKCKVSKADSKSGSGQRRSIRTSSSKRRAALELQIIEEGKKLAEKRLADSQAKALELQAATEKAQAEIDKEYLHKKQQALLEDCSSDDGDSKDYEQDEQQQRNRTASWVKSTVGVKVLEPAFSEVQISDTKCEILPSAVPAGMCSAKTVTLNEVNLNEPASKQLYLHSNGLNGLGSTYAPICATSTATTNSAPAMYEQQQQSSTNACDALKCTVPMTITTYGSGMLHGQRNVDASFTSVAANWQGSQPQHRSTMPCYQQPSTAPNYAQPTNVFMQPTTSMYIQPPSSMNSQPTNVYTQPTSSVYAQPPSSTYSQTPHYSQPMNTLPTNVNTQPPASMYVQISNVPTMPANVATNTYPHSSIAPNNASAPMYVQTPNVLPANLASNTYQRSPIAANIASATIPPHIVSSASQNQYQVPNYLPQYTAQNMPAAPNYLQQPLNNNQFAARHALPKELPSFSGKPEEWPIFISSFEGTTRTCGFSNEENLIRLQRCLKGKALEAVSCRLLLPSSVPDVIQTLRMLFGRPELIINTLLQKIRNEPSPKAEKLDSLINFSLSVQNLCGTMEASGLMAHLFNPMLMQELTEKLPAHIKLNWAIFQQSVPAPNLSTLSQWLFQIAQAASTVAIPTQTQSNAKPDQRSTAKHKGQVFAHSNSDCQTKEEPKMEDLDRRQRWKRVIDNKLCRRCLKKHLSTRCKITSVCGINGCQRRHHPLLHNDEPEGSTNHEDNKEKKACNAHQTCSGEGLLFRIVPVVLYGKRKSLKTFAFLDEGSSLTMLEESVAEELELDGTPETLCLKWTGNTVRTEPTSRRVTLEVAGNVKGSKRYTLRDVRTVTSLDLPVQSIRNEELAKKYPHLIDVPFADYHNAIPRILIGIDNWKLGLPTEIKEGRWREPVAAKTRLGWTVQGFYHHQRLQPVHHHMHVCECNDSDDLLHAQVKEFFSTENFGVKAPTKIIESADDSRAKNLLESTTNFLGDRFETGLLWKYDDVRLPDSMPMARRRHACLEKKMATDPVLAQNLQKQISEYIGKGYARKLTIDELHEDSPRIWYLPLFSVTNPNKPGKFRMVWDAAAKVNGISLNSMLLKGPDQLSSLPYVLYGLRMRKIGISADIREMFHQVRIRPADQHAQRFLWRDGQNGSEPEAYVMQVMTFGASCSPSSAQFVKNSNALRFADRFPRATDAILNHHYVDDLLDSVDTVEGAVKLAKDIIHVHQQGGFDIRNWLSNSTEVLEALQMSTLQSNKNLSISTELPTEKVLGMWWNTKIDCFTYTITCAKVDKDVLAGRRRPTKREVLRTLMSIFDPLGFLSVFLVFIKMLLQDIWRSSVDWDEHITNKQFEKWSLWINLLPEVENVRIPRVYCFKISSLETKETQLHVYVDASESAYAAVAYFRFATANHVECSLIGAKTKVATTTDVNSAFGTSSGSFGC